MRIFAKKQPETTAAGMVRFARAFAATNLQDANKNCWYVE
jgi:hypothetical protein